MNVIHRDIYITKKLRIPPIDIVRGSYIKIELQLMDYDIPEGATAHAYARGRYAPDTYRNTCSIAGKNISFLPQDGFFIPGPNRLQIEINSVIIPFSIDVNCESRVSDAGEPATPEKVTPLVLRAETAATKAEQSQQAVETLRDELETDYPLVPQLQHELAEVDSRLSESITEINYFDSYNSNGYTKWQDGVFVQSQSIFDSNLIPCRGGYKFVARFEKATGASSVTDAVPAISLYDENKNWIEGYTEIEKTISEATPEETKKGFGGVWVEFTIKNNHLARYFSLYLSKNVWDEKTAYCFYNTKDGNRKLKGKMPYSALYYDKQPNVDDIDGLRDELSDLSNKIPQVGEYTKTYTNWDVFEWTSGYMLRDGTFSEYATGMYSELIDARKIKSISYVLREIGKCDIIACYDASGNYLKSKSVISSGSGSTWAFNEGTFVPSEGISYIRIGRFTNAMEEESQEIEIIVSFEEDYKDTKSSLAKQWANKKWVAFGTSITDTHNTLAPDGSCTGKYVPYLERLSGMACVNYGIAGGTISNGGLHGSSGNILTKIKSDSVLSDLQSADLVTIEGFVNDFVGNVPRGTVLDTQSTTLMGAIYQAVTHIYTANPKATVVLLTEHTGRNTDSGSFNVDRVNEFDEYQYQYDDAVVEVAKFLNVHCIDCGRKSQINQWHPGYLIDHIHHTENGGEQFANAIWDELKNIHCNSDLFR